MTVTARAVVSVGKVVVGMDVLGTAGGAFELLASGALIAVAQNTLVVGTAWGHLQLGVDD